MREHLFNRIVLQLITIRSEQLRPQEWRRIKDIVFLRLASAIAISLRRSSALEPTHPFIQLGSLDGNDLRLLIVVQLIISRLFFHDLPQDEREQLFMVTRLREVLAEALRRRVSQSRHQHKP